MADMRSMTEDEFDEEFKPVTFEHEFGIEAPQGGVTWVEFEVAKQYPVERVWTVVDTEDGEYALPGFRVVNRFMYVVTQVPWPDENIEVKFDSVDDEEEPDGAPCCPDPGCPGRFNVPGSCTFPGYADNH